MKKQKLNSNLFILSGDEPIGTGIYLDTECPEIPFPGVEDEPFEMGVVIARLHAKPDIAKHDLEQNFEHEVVEGLTMMYSLYPLFDFSDSRDEGQTYRFCPFTGQHIIFPSCIKEIYRYCGLFIEEYRVYIGLSDGSWWRLVFEESSYLEKYMRTISINLLLKNR